MPVLNWIGKEKIVNHDKEVPFRLLRKNKKYSLGKNENLIIEGDNLEALKALMPFYYGKIKCIYIDPPYNTGNEKWVYNDRVNAPKIKEWLGRVVGPEGEDLCRHDKWLCMMYPRLKLLHDLLSDSGYIFVSIDDNEHCNFKKIMDDIFGPENFITTFIWNKKNVVQNDARFASVNHDYVVCYVKKLNDNKFNLLPRTRKLNERYENPDSDPRGLWTSVALQAKSGSESNIYKITFPKKKRSWSKEILPYGVVTWKPVSGTYPRLTKESLLKAYREGRLWFGKDGKNVPRFKKYLNEVKQGIVSNSILIPEEVGSTQMAKETIKRILGKNIFETPKPVELIKRFIQLSCDKKDLILDSFAGSGTTAHAVLSLNKEDGGNRKFILVELEKNIAKKITAERVKRVSRGYSYKTGKGKVVKIPGLGGGFEYVELGEPLFNENGMINEKVSYSDMARYIFFTETHTNLENRNIKENYLGRYGDYHYFLLFDGIKNNILNRKFLKEIKKKDGKKIVYADKCLLDEDVLDKYQIIFKQIPYQIKVY